MKRLLQILILSLSLTACSQDKVTEYYLLVDRVTRIEIHFKTLDRKIELDNTQVETFKEIMTQNVEAEKHKKFVADIQINLYDKDSRIGFLLITENATNPFVNFGSDDLNFGFKLTYGIGQYLNEIN